jgi:hypothetical protein
VTRTRGWIEEKKCRIRLSTLAAAGLAKALHLNGRADTAGLLVRVVAWLMLLNSTSCPNFPTASMPYHAYRTTRGWKRRQLRLPWTLLITLTNKIKFISNIFV